jgi:hypothetical protein
VDKRKLRDAQGMTRGECNRGKKCSVNLKEKKKTRQGTGAISIGSICNEADESLFLPSPPPLKKEGRMSSLVFSNLKPLFRAIPYRIEEATVLAQRCRRKKGGKRGGRGPKKQVEITVRIVCEVHDGCGMVWCGVFRTPKNGLQLLFLCARC